MRDLTILGAGVVFVGTLAIAWFTHGTGVVHNDPERNISVPEQLTMPLQVQAAFNDQNVHFRYRWPAERPGIMHDVLRYEDGSWVRAGRAVPGSAADGLHEDRVAMLLDDGSVPAFGRYGGYITVGAGLAGLTDEAPEGVSKYLPATRNRLGDWADMAPDDVQAQLRAAGYFLDLWHWRGHRSNPLDVADDQYVGHERGGDAGRSSYATNWDGDLAQPLLMFDPAVVGISALNWDDLSAGRITQDMVYYLRDDQALPFDPDAGWQNGDTLPRRILRQPAESRADIRVGGGGRWADGFWDVTLTRALDTGSPLDDKILKEKGVYDVAFSIHRDATGGRWHYVSLPMTVGLGREAEMVATRLTGAAPTWDDNWTEVTLFYPGQVTWPRLISATHAGAGAMESGIPVKARHSEIQLAHYGVEGEFSAEIHRQWLLTLAAGLLLIVAFGVALNAGRRNPVSGV